MRAQLLSLDFILAAVVLTMVLGVFVYNVDLIQKNLQTQSELFDNNVDAIAQLIIDGKTSWISSDIDYCFYYTSEAECFLSCSKVFAATRFISEIEVLRVKVCG
ncbi:MAG: hypothetical protein ABH803_00505 [Candidatus Micrarchaeota archaeon]